MSKAIVFVLANKFRDASIIIGALELWIRSPLKRKNWVLDIHTPYSCGTCTMVEIGFLGFNWLRGECRYGEGP